MEVMQEVQTRLAEALLGREMTEAKFEDMLTETEIHGILCRPARYHFSLLFIMSKDYLP